MATTLPFETGSTRRGTGEHQATQNEEDGPEHGHPRLPWVIGLVEEWSREYAREVLETLARQGGSSSEEGEK